MRIPFEGEAVTARVAGFLPGRRVMLDMEGGAVIAVSDLPLTLGRLITARVERYGGAVRLRVIAEAEAEPDADWGAAAPPAGAAPDGLDRAIARHARGWGIPVTRSFLDRVRREIALADPDLAKGMVVPLEKAEREAAWIVAAFARGLDPTARSLAALGTDGEARLGTVLDRLERSLRQWAERLDGAAGRRAAEWAKRLRGFFVDLGDAPVAEAIARGILLAGYAYEEKLARRGAIGWHDAAAAEAESGEDLKGFLLLLHRRLGRLEGGDIPREGRDDALRVLERARAWTARALDRIESLQVGNLPGPDGSGRTEEYQIPVRFRGTPGTFHLFLSGGKTRCWLEWEGGGPIGLEADTGGEPPVLRVLAETVERLSPERTERIRERIAALSPAALVRIDSPQATAGFGGSARPVDLSV